MMHDMRDLQCLNAGITPGCYNGMDDVEAYNNYDEMPLFIDFPKKISVVEKNLPKDILTWERKGVKGKVITAGQLVVERGVFV